MFGSVTRPAHTLSVSKTIVLRITIAMVRFYPALFCATPFASVARSSFDKLNPESLVELLI
jgi:hypothetical protein